MKNGCDGGGGKPKAVSWVIQAWSSGSAGTDLFFAGPAMETAEWSGAKASVEIEATSGAAEIEIARFYSLSNDMITWDTPVAMTTDTGFVSALGYDYGTTYTAASVSRRYIRFGFTTNQKSGSAIEQIRVRYMLEREPR